MILEFYKQLFAPFSFGGGGGGQSQTQTVEPYSAQQPYLDRGFERAEDLYNSQFQQFYPGQTFAPFAPEQAYALTAQTNRALNGSPLVGKSQQQIDSTLSGDYLGANPYLDQEFSRVEDKINSSINSNFSKAGRYGSGLHKSEIADKIGQAAGQFYGDNYRNERTNQLRAASYAPQLANQDYFDIAQLAQAGDARQAMGQRFIDEQKARHDFNDPYSQDKQRLADYTNFVGGNYGSQSTSETPTNGTSTGLGLLGLGLSAFGGGSGSFLGGLFS